MSKPAIEQSDLWMFFARRFNEEYGFQPNPRDKSVREYFSWYAWGHFAHGMGWAVSAKPSPILDDHTQPEPPLCICGNVACDGGDLCRECWDEWDDLQSRNQTSSASGGDAPN
jgi:hypothetical protein